MNFRKRIFARLNKKASNWNMRNKKTIEGEVTDPDTNKIYFYSFSVGKPSRSRYIKPEGDGWNEPRTEGYFETDGTNLESEGVYILQEGTEDNYIEVTDPKEIEKVEQLVINSGTHDDEISEMEEEALKREAEDRFDEPDDY